MGHLEFELRNCITMFNNNCGDCAINFLCKENGRKQF